MRDEEKIKKVKELARQMNDLFYEESKHRDPNTFEIGDLVTTAPKYVTDASGYLLTYRSIKGGRVINKDIRLLEFDDPILGRLRVLTKNEIFKVSTPKYDVYKWINDTYDKVDSDNDERIIDSCVYCMPVEEYKKWRAEQEKPKTRPMTWREIKKIAYKGCITKSGIWYSIQVVAEDTIKINDRIINYNDFHKNCLQPDRSKFEVDFE